jgi:hypothetical protein
VEEELTEVVEEEAERSRFKVGILEPEAEPK